MNPLVSRRRPLAAGLGRAGGLIGVAAGSWGDTAATPAAHWWRVLLGVLGTIPFAVLAWTSIVPLLVTAEALAITATHPAPERAT